MGDARQTMRSTQPFSLSTSINSAGGGASQPSLPGRMSALGSQIS